MSQNISSFLDELLEKYSIEEMVELNFPVDVINRIRQRLEIRKGILAKEKAANRLNSFITYTKEDYETNWHHSVICEGIDDFLFNPLNDTEILILQAPPRTGKTEIVSRRLPAYILGRKPDYNVVFSTYAAELAKKINRDVQRIMDTQKYVNIFPDTNLSGSKASEKGKSKYIRTSEMFEIVNRAGSFKSVGVGGPLTGYGFNVGIIDDIVKGLKEAMSSTVSDATWDWYQSVFFTRRAPNAKIIVMMTRWAEHDLIGRILSDSKKNSTKVEVLSFPMLYSDDLDLLNPLDPRLDEGEPLWESRFDLKFCEKTKETVGSKVWYSLYQQSPLPSGGAIFERSWFNYYRELPEFDYTLLSLDCAFKESQTSDYVVFGVWGIKGKRKYLIEVYRDRMSFPTTLTQLYLILAKFPKLSELIIEAKANGDAVISTLDTDPRITIPIFAYSPSDSKEARATAISPQVEAGHIFLPDVSYEENYSKTWVTDFLEELVGFPNKKNDDQVDMTTQAVLRASNSTMGWFEAMDEQSREEMQNTIDTGGIGALSNLEEFNKYFPNTGGIKLGF